MSIEETLRAIVREETLQLRSELAELRAIFADKATTHEHAEPLLTVEQVAARLGNVNPDTVRTWIHHRRLRAQKVGHRWLVKSADLARFEVDASHEKEAMPADEHLRLLLGRAAGGSKG